MTEAMPDASTASPSDEGMPTAPRDSQSSAERLEVFGILTSLFFLLAAPFHWWEAWNVGTSAALRRLDPYVTYIAGLLVLLGVVAGAYTLARAWPIARDLSRPMAQRLSAGYAFSYAAFALLIVGSVATYLGLRG